METRQLLAAREAGGMYSLGKRPSIPLNITNKKGKQNTGHDQEKKKKTNDLIYNLNE